MCVLWLVCNAIEYDAMHNWKCRTENQQAQISVVTKRSRGGLLKLGLGWLFQYYIANSAGRRERSNSIGKCYKLIYWRGYLSRLLGVSTKTTRVKSRNNSGQNPLSA